MKPVEVSWFSALCDDDYEFLGNPTRCWRRVGSIAAISF